ncbi:MAG: acyltransferase family protein [Nodosilinea sp.]
MQTTSRIENVTSSKRLAWLDLAKSYGMILVFLGHILEAFYMSGFSSALLSYKAIYSFHVPLFFILSGFLSKPFLGGLKEYLKLKFWSRIMPFVFFNIIGLACLMLIDFVKGKQNIFAYLSDGLLLLKGIPVFNVTTWFLMCLFAVEILHFLVSRLFSARSLRFLVALGLFFVGWFITFRYPQLVVNVWFFPEALVAYLFYSFGIQFKHQGWFSKAGESKNLTGFGVCFVITLLTFNLNQNFFSVDPPVVIMGYSSHGQPLLFLITGLAGSLAVIYLARWVALSQRLVSLQTRLGIQSIGLNTLILLGLNGLLVRWFNYTVAKRLITLLPAQPVAILMLSVVLTVISLVLCIPAVVVLRRYFPKTVGLGRP